MYTLFLSTDPVTFQTENGTFLYNNSIINDGLDNRNITIYCRSINENENLKFSSDNMLLNDYFNGDILGGSPLVINNTRVIAHQSTAYDLSLYITAYSGAVDGNISCYSQLSGESTTILLTNGELHISQYTPY